MKYDKVVVIDLETTGLSHKKDKIIEIGCISYDPVKRKRKYFNTIIKVDKVPLEITRITGIDQKLVDEQGTSLENAVSDFLEFCNSDCKKPLFVGHNAFSFDKFFINKALKLYKAPIIRDTHLWDTMKHFSSHINKCGLNSKKDLQSTCKFYGLIPEKQKHRALPDCKNTLRVFLKQYKLEKSRILKYR